VRGDGNHKVRLFEVLQWSLVPWLTEKECLEPSSTGPDCHITRMQPHSHLSRPRAVRPDGSHEGPGIRVDDDDLGLGSVGHVQESLGIERHVHVVPRAQHARPPAVEQLACAT
jgi:hypothetical protein